MLEGRYAYVKYVPNTLIRANDYSPLQTYEKRMNNVRITYQ